MTNSDASKMINEFMENMNLKHLDRLNRYVEIEHHQILGKRRSPTQDADVIILDSDQGMNLHSKSLQGTGNPLKRLRKEGRSPPKKKILPTRQSCRIRQKAL